MYANSLVDHFCIALHVSVKIMSPNKGITTTHAYSLESLFTKVCTNACLLSLPPRAFLFWERPGNASLARKHAYA